jgi:hypothetical protein
MRQFILAAAFAALIVPAAHAQQGGDPNREAQEAAEKREKAALDRQYRNGLKNLPAAQHPKNDPWAQMRAPSAGSEKK